MATIEPRLIHLLNKSPSPEQRQTSNQNHAPEQFHTFEQHLNNQLPLPPIDVDNGVYRGDHWSSQRQIPSLSSLNDVADNNTSRPVGREPGHLSLDMMLQDPDPYHMSYTQSNWNQAVDTTTDRDGANKKRQRNNMLADDMFHLPNPHPLKKQRSAQQVMPMPPIINGLYSPPPPPPVGANVFPRIEPSTGSFPNTEQSGDHRGRPQMRTSSYNDHTLSGWSGSVDPRLCELPREDMSTNTVHVDPEETPTSESGKKRKVTKRRRPWTADETTNLLLGVKKHGKGNWTKILADPEFNIHFNQRKTTDLKDRFRSIFPETISEETQDELHTRAVSEPIPATRTSLPLDMLLLADEDEDQPTALTGWSKATQTSDSTTGKRKTGPRSHRMDVENLRKLGIDGPLKESGRKKRILFTEEEDKQILEGLEKHGPQWTLIRNDPEYNLTARRPTDLRDRIRNKYPDTFQKLVEHKHARPRSSLYQTLPNPASTPEGSSSALPANLEPSVSRRTSKETMLPDRGDGQSSHMPLPSSDSSEMLPGITRLDMGTEHPYATGMDFSRLRLSGDDSQSHVGTATGSMEDLNSSRWPSRHPLPYSGDLSEVPRPVPSEYGRYEAATSSLLEIGHAKLPPRQRSLSPLSRVLARPFFHNGSATYNDLAEPEPSFGSGRQQRSWKDIALPDDSSGDQPSARKGYEQTVLN